MFKLQIKSFLLLLAFAHFINSTAQEWEYLLDKNLSQLEVLMGVSHVHEGLLEETYGIGISRGTPLGSNSDTLNEFSMIPENGEDVLKITGGVYGDERSTSFLRLEAEDADDEAGTQVEQYNDTSYNVGFINNNDWLKFEDINLTDVKILTGHVASRFQGGDIEVRLGSTSGTLIGTMHIVNTGENQDYELFEASINKVSGIHDVYFVFTGGSGFLFNVDWLEFTLTPTTTVQFSDTDTSSKIVSTLNKVEITAYPNPTNGTLTVTNFSKNAVIDIIDIWGKQIPVNQFMVNENMYMLDLTTVNPGMYILQVNGKTQNIIRN